MSGVSRRRVSRLAAWVAIGAAVGRAGGPALSVSVADLECDVILQRTDAGGSAPYDPLVHRPPDVVRVVIGNWQPVDPQADVFVGSFSGGGAFLRIDVRFAGLQNPPGATAPASFAPFEYGPHPVYGFLEVDIDLDNHTGGETDAPQFRYPANVARFGGVPAGDRFEDRVLRTPDDDDLEFESSPYVERSGEEFHLALLPTSFAAGGITRLVGDADGIFESGETWVLSGRWFHRAHGFEPFSLAKGGAAAGEYMPISPLRFSHDATSDETAVSLVFPLTNAAAAALSGAAAQPNNADPSDQASVEEGLVDLMESAQFALAFPSGAPEEALITGWALENPANRLDAWRWRMTMLTGASYSAAGFGFVWTDVMPNPTRGDVNGENGVDHGDFNNLADYIEGHDLDDGVNDDRVALSGFPASFAVFDVSGDGVVDEGDGAFLSRVGDADLDDDVDLHDFARLQACSGQFGGIACELVDLNRDGWSTNSDACWFAQILNGPE
ncbi:MAG: hypothetical protein SF069_13960 [Phycisphaerae bacterium]|nr:hypothetical protein [Phycisphaerae bacterium]